MDSSVSEPRNSTAEQFLEQLNETLLDPSNAWIRGDFFRYYCQWARKLSSEMQHERYVGIKTKEATPDSFKLIDFLRIIIGQEKERILSSSCVIRAMQRDAHAVRTQCSAQAKPNKYMGPAVID